MLRILRDGKAISLKEQDKLVNEKGSKENVGRPIDFTRPAYKPPPKYAGLSKPKPKPKENKYAQSSETKKKY